MISRILRIFFKKMSKDIFKMFYLCLHLRFFVVWAIIEMIAYREKKLKYLKAKLYIFIGYDKFDFVITEYLCFNISVKYISFFFINCKQKEKIKQKNKK